MILDIIKQSRVTSIEDTIFMHTLHRLMGRNLEKSLGSFVFGISARKVAVYDLRRKKFE